jgi:hypothetical protein
MARRILGKNRKIGTEKSGKEVVFGEGKEKCWPGW